MATTLLDLIKEVAELFGQVHIGSAGTGSTSSTIVDRALIEPDDFWINHYAYIMAANSVPPEAEERYVSDYVQATGTLSIAPAYTALVDAGDTYILLPLRRGVMVRAINNAIQSASNRWGVPTIDTTTVTLATSTYQYTLPADLIWLEDVLYRSATTSPWRPIERAVWSVAGTPGAQMLELSSISAFTVGNPLRLDYIKRLPQLAEDDDALAIGPPAEAELKGYLLHHTLWYLHTLAANRGISDGTFREHLTLAKNAGEAAQKALDQAPRWQRTGRWHVPQRPAIRG